MINAMRQQNKKIASLERDNEERKVREATQQKAEDTTPILGNRLMLTAGPGGPMPQQSYANGIAPQATGFGGF